MFFTDRQLCERWGCSKMKLWRLRQRDQLHSIKLGGAGPWMTREDEVARLEAPPDYIRKPAPEAATSGSGREAALGCPSQSAPNISAAPVETQPQNGGAR